MRPHDEWFKPEQLRRYYYAYEAVALAVLLAVVALLALTGILAAMQPWVVLVGGGVAVVAFASLTWWITAFYRTADYRLTADEVEYRRGVFFRQKTTVPYNRITNVNAAQGPVQRLVGAGSVGVHTAGYGGQMGAELTITGIGDYEDVRDQILERVRKRPPEATEGEDTADAVVTAPQSARDAEASEVLAELRRIRELLEQGRAAQ